MSTVDASLPDRLRGRHAEMVAATRALVEVESPSSDLEALRRCADVCAEIGQKVTGVAADLAVNDGRPLLRWRFGDAPRLLLLGHFDTVWPLGTLQRLPFTERDGRLTGPGVFDMKAGIVQGFFALAALDDPGGVEILLDADEETGSASSRDAIAEAARRVDAVLVLEPSQDGALKTARKGVSMYRIEIEGRAAHAGLEPHKGVNATVELAHAVLALERIARPDLGTTVTPTVAAAGTAVNVVPAAARLQVDVRALTPAEQDRVDAEIHDLAATLPGARLAVHGAPDRPPLPAASSAALFERARDVARRLGLGELRGVEVGGGSDGNLTAAEGTPTLDGMGAVGDGAHAETEHVLSATMPERAALLAALIHELRG
ncbi:MAG TPA: M20 family metallopeptidase [Candidatus Dormibacteraeota bacterium]|nr:M20 family metallopeptidase [Candidatus Dormibacteraeota bacterium]